MAEEHPKEVSGNNNSPDPIEEDLSESHNSHKILDDTLVDRASTGEKGGDGDDDDGQEKSNFRAGGCSLQPGNQIIEGANKVMNESVDKTINTSDNIRPRSECDGGTKQLKLKNITKGKATNEILKARAMDRIYKKIGEEKAKEILALWEELKKSKQEKKELQAEGDGIIKTLLSLGFSKIEVTTFLKVGGPRVNRIMEAIKNPGKLPTNQKPAHAASESDIKNVLDYITGLDLEPGYPCAHKKIPLYVVGDHQGSTWAILHKEYEKNCIKSGVRVLSYNRFREYSQHYLPSIKLGKTQTDLCNECYHIKLKLKDPEVSAAEKGELKLRLGMHLDEANVQRRAMNAYIEAVKKKIAPDDPPLRFEPCYIPPVEDEILNEALDLFKESKNPVLEDEEEDEEDDDEVEVAVEESNSNKLVVLQIWEDEGTPSSSHKILDDTLVDRASAGEKGGQDGDDGQEKSNSPIQKLTENAKNSLLKNLMERTVSKRAEYAGTINQDAVTKMDLEIEDYGQEKLLPSYKLRRPGADYFNSSLNIRNMNFINPTSLGQSSIYLYDERTGGKGGNEVCSIRFHNLRKVVKARIENKQTHPVFHVSVLDNCTGQNKSNTAFKFEALQTVLGIFQAKIKLFLKPGHSHNQSDVVTGESNKYLAKKDVFTIGQIATEMNKCEKVDVSVLGQESFNIWEDFLNKHFKNLPVGFTKFYCYEFSGGSVAMKRLCSDVTDNEVVVKEIVRDPANAKKTILKELFDLPPDASLDDIINASLLLPKLPAKELKPSKLESLAKKFSCIPSEFVSFYPGGESFLKKAKESTEDEDAEDVVENLVSKKPGPGPGRPKIKKGTKTPAGTQSILRFFCAPKIPVIKAGDNVKAFGSKVLDLGSSDPMNNNYLSGGNSLLLNNQGQKDVEELVDVDITDDPPTPKGTKKRTVQKKGDQNFIEDFTDESSDEEETSRPAKQPKVSNCLDNDETEERSKSVESQDFSSEKYRLFMRLLHKCWHKSGSESVDISVLKKFIEVQEVAVPIDETEVEMFLDMMVFENKVLIDDSIVYSI